MNRKKQRLIHMLLLPLLFSVLFVPKTAFAEGYSCETSIPAAVETTGDKAPEGTQYKVVLEAVTEGAPMPGKTGLVIKSGEKAEFGPMKYTVPGDYQYKICQEDGKENRFTYDRSVYIVTVRVVNEENGGLKSEMWAVKEGSTDKTNEIKFKNHYDAPSSHDDDDDEDDPAPAAPQPPVNLLSPKTGDSANPVFWGILAVIALLAVVVLLKRRSRREEE